MADNSVENKDVCKEESIDHSTTDVCMNASGTDEDDAFIWQDYLDVTKTTEVPQILFSHVEESLCSYLQVGMILEVPLKKPNQFWVAYIVMVCGPLLRMRYVGQEEDRKQEFWCDLTKVTAHPVGWCEENNMQYTVPDELQDKLLDPNSFVKNVVQTAVHAPVEVLCGKGLIPIERIVPGMKLEVQDEVNPYHLWIATILENIGGRLFLRYDTPHASLPEFWLFYTSPRLYPIGWVAEKGLPWVLMIPVSIAGNYSDGDWNAVLEMAQEDARHVPLPSELFQHDKPCEPHQFTVGMKLESLHPHNRNELCPATVTKVFDSFYFLVQIDTYNDEEKLSWLCTMSHPYIFPVGWAQEHDLHLAHPPGWTSEFTWTKYLIATLSQAALKSCFFKHSTARKTGFKQGMKLEVVNPQKQHQICAATIVKTMEHLMWISIESHDSAHPGYIMNIDSLDIFPVGWCESNSYPLQPPRFYKIPAKPVKNVTVETVESENSLTRRSTWCPKIYFNHRCFSGPFLCKGKLAKLPKSVGPGPVTLVMREVLSMLISIAYKSSRVLKVLQVNGLPERGLHCEAFKAKFKTIAYSANICMVTSADKVPAFCKDVCRQLRVCPNLFGLSLYSESCPDKCFQLSKSRFTHYVSTANRGRPKEVGSILKSRKKRHGRKLLSVKELNSQEELPISHEDFNCLLALAGITKNYQDHASHDLLSSTQQLVAPSGCITSATKIKRRYKKKVIPLTQMKTRGAKLPNYSKHWSRKGGWKRLDLRKRAMAVFSAPEQKSALGKRVFSPLAQIPLYEDPLANVIRLESDPRTWSEREVFQYLKKTDDCAQVAQLCKDELIDGPAFLLLNLPTMCEHMHLKMEQALKLCYHVEQLKLAFHVQYGCDL